MKPSKSRFVSLFLALIMIITANGCQATQTVGPTASQTPTPLISSSQTTNRVDLNFNVDWRYYMGDVSGADTKAYNDTEWTYVDLPHSTKFVTPEDPNAYLGISWYRKHFSVAGEYQGGKVYIEFEAAMQSADVWVNGVKKIRHEGGYTPFTIDITDDVTYGGADNVIAVKVDSNANPDWAPGWNGVDFQYDGGLYRDVNMYVTDRLHVTDAVYANKVAGGGVFVTYPSVSTGSATVHIQTNIINEHTDVKNTVLQSEIVDDSGKVVGSAVTTDSISAGADYDFVQDITLANPKLWHPYTPILYTLRTTVKDGSTVVDFVTTRIGIRQIEWSQDGGLIINGSRFKALGVNMHQEIYGLGNAVPNRSIYYDVKRIKDAGLNFIRGSHYPHDPAFYDACDELGILVLDAQTGWQKFNDTTAFKDNTYQELRDMIRRDRNHPSVVAWEASLNESNFSDAWAKTANDIVHAEYPGDQAFSASWKGHYADIFIDASQHGVRVTYDQRPIIIDEYGDWDYGGASSTSRKKREDGDIAMLAQADNVQDGESKNMALDWFTADGYWDYADYGGFTGYGITRSGLVDMYRLPKYAYYFLQSQRDPNIIISGVDSGPMVYIANQWTSSSPTTVRVYSNCDQVSLYLNGAMVAARSPDTGTSLLHPPFNFDLGGFTAGTLQADCLMGGVQRASFTRKTPGQATAIRLRAEGTTLQADLSDARLIFIEVVDADGTVVPTDSHQVNLSISGPGSIVGPNLVTMKGGQLATWVRASRSTGTITLAAAASGLTSASLYLISQAATNLPPPPIDRGNK
jgi:hypothetical protein